MGREEGGGSFYSRGRTSWFKGTSTSDTPPPRGSTLPYPTPRSWCTGNGDFIPRRTSPVNRRGENKGTGHLDVPAGRTGKGGPHPSASPYPTPMFPKCKRWFVIVVATTPALSPQDPSSKREGRCSKGVRPGWTCPPPRVVTLRPGRVKAEIRGGRDWVSLPPRFFGSLRFSTGVRFESGLGTVVEGDLSTPPSSGVL